MKKYESYIRAWDRRETELYAESEKKRHEAYQYALKCKEILVDRFNVTKVILFGSILNEGNFNSSSDIDIAVEGLSSEQYFEALAALMMESEWNVDLKPIEDLKGLILERVIKGKIIYEKRENT